MRVNRLASSIAWWRDASSGCWIWPALPVLDSARTYEEWSARGAEFLTEPKDHGREIRAYLRDPDGHLIEVGQATRLLD